MFYYRHIWRRTNTTFFGAAFFSTPDDEKVSLGVFGLPLGSIACCLFPVVRHLKAVFVPSPRGWDVITPNLAQLVSHGVTCWQADPDLSIFTVFITPRQGGATQTVHYVQLLSQTAPVLLSKMQNTFKLTAQYGNYLSTSLVWDCCIFSWGSESHLKMICNHQENDELEQISISVFPLFLSFPVETILLSLLLNSTEDGFTLKTNDPAGGAGDLSESSLGM